MSYLALSPSKWQRLQELTVTTFLGNIPRLFLGPQLRSRVYPAIFKSLKRPVYIQEGVELLGSQSISVESKASLFKGVRIDARGIGNSVIIGQDASLQRGVDIRALDRTEVVIGQSTFIGPYVCLTGPGHIEIGDRCSIAAHCGIFANNHKFSDPTRSPNAQGHTRQGIVIEKECWIGHSVSILDGIRVGEGSVIGAGSVVTRDIPSKSVAVGSPAKVIKNRERLNLCT